MNGPMRTPAEIAAWHEELGKRYRDLESELCDMRHRGYVIETYLSQTLKQTQFAPKFGDSITIVLSEEELDALHFIIAEQQTHVLRLHKRFYTDMECEP